MALLGCGEDDRTATAAYAGCGMGAVKPSSGVFGGGIAAIVVERKRDGSQAEITPTSGTAPKCRPDERQETRELWPN
jgi:hypothetical protein